MIYESAWKETLTVEGSFKNTKYFGFWFQKLVLVGTWLHWINDIFHTAHNDAVSLASFRFFLCVCEIHAHTSSSESLSSCARRTLMLRNKRFMSTRCLRETLVTRLCCRTHTNTHTQTQVNVLTPAYNNTGKHTHKKRACVCLSVCV